GTACHARRRGGAAERARRIVLIGSIQQVPDRSGFRAEPRARLPDRLGRFEAPPLGLLLLSFRDESREIARPAERITDLVEVEEEDLLAVAQDTVSHEAGAKGPGRPADVGVVAAIEPVVVLLGQRTGRARGREDLLKPREIVGTIRERLPCTCRDLIRARAHLRAPDLRILRGGAKPLPD